MIFNPNSYDLISSLFASFTKAFSNRFRIWLDAIVFMFATFSADCVFGPTFLGHVHDWPSFFLPRFCTILSFPTNLFSLFSLFNEYLILLAFPCLLALFKFWNLEIFLRLHFNVKHKNSCFGEQFNFFRFIWSAKMS